MKTEHTSGPSIAAQVLAAADVAAANGRPFVLAISPAAITESAVDAFARSARALRSAHVFLADTRFDACGGATAEMRELLERLPLRRSQLHLDVADYGDPERAAAAYEQELRAFFGLSIGDLPVFDMVVLRLAASGDVAGLASESHALDETSRLAVANRPRAGGRRFVTLTPPVIQRAGRVFVTHCRSAAIARDTAGIPGRLLSAPNVTLLLNPAA